MKFSQRNGVVTLPESLQPDQVTRELRASLWNALHLGLWDAPGVKRDSIGNYGSIISFARQLWFRHFKLPFSDIPRHPTEILERLEKYFFACAWHEMYDFLEAVLDLAQSQKLRRFVGDVLETELAAYQLVGDQFVQITDPQELAALQETLSAGGRFAPVAAHFKRALELLSDRTKPDFRNSIKESISGVEAAACIVSGRSSATLGDALKTLERDHDLHKALKEGFSKLYGYTSDENGIRHAMLEEPDLSRADAKFFLLSCTSFVNYLKARSATLPA
jgi:hypothetical protein